MVVPAHTHGGGQNNTGRVDGLPDIVQIDPSGDFLDEHGRQSFGPQILVGNEEIDLGRLDRVVADSCFNRNTRDKGNQFLVARLTDTDMPVGHITWRS